MALVYVSIGSNIDREHNIRSAVAVMNRHFEKLVLSSVYETQAQGFTGDPFYNLVARFETTLSPADINGALRAIESQHGRRRGEEKFSPRSLDLDLLLYNQDINETQNIPRDEITRYAFVLLPLVEIAPDLIHPRRNQSMRELWGEFAATHDVSSTAIHRVDFNWES